MNQGTKLIPYKNYVGNILLDFNTKVYYGYIQDIDFEMMYEGTTLEELQEDFESCVDEYLRMLG